MSGEFKSTHFTILSVLRCRPFHKKPEEEAGEEGEEMGSPKDETMKREGGAETFSHLAGSKNDSVTRHVFCWMSQTLMTLSRYDN